VLGQKVNKLLLNERRED